MVEQKRKPWCETCGAIVHEILCPTCAKWWDDNLAAEQRGREQERAAVVKWLREQDGHGYDDIRANLIEGGEHLK